MRCNYGGAHYFTILMPITNITLYYHICAECCSRGSALTGYGRVFFSRSACVCGLIWAVDRVREGGFMDVAYWEGVKELVVGYMP